MGNYDEEFKSKAQELLQLVAAKTLPPEKLEPIRELFNQAKTIYDEGRVEEALALVVQAIKNFK